MRPHSTQQKSNSLRTFFLFSGIVLFFIVLSLSIKIFFLFQQSKFDGEHQFLLSVGDENHVSELYIFNPQDRIVTEVTLEGQAVKQNSLGSTLGIIPDAHVTSSFFSENKSVADSINEISWHFSSFDTNMTIIDAFRLLVATQHASVNKQDEQRLEITKDVESVDQKMKNLFVDDKIFAENISVQIVNASDQPGLGRRLERALRHLGCNVVDITSSRKEEEHSSIRYYGEKSYTLEKIESLINFSLEKTEKKTIADIVIIIGNDEKYKTIF